MKSVLIQSIIRRRRREVMKNDPEGRDIEHAANMTVGLIFTTLLVLIIGSVAFAN